MRWGHFNVQELILARLKISCSDKVLGMNDVLSRCLVLERLGCLGSAVDGPLRKELLDSTPTLTLQW